MNQKASEIMMRSYRLGISNRFKAYIPPMIGDILQPNDDYVCWLAGGSVRTLFTGEPIHDFDLFCKNEFTKIRLLSYLDNCPHVKSTFRCKEGKLYTFLYYGHKIQLICPRYYDSMHELIDCFDFTVTQYATNGYDLWVGDTTLRDTRGKSLRINKITYPAATVKRVSKYISYGYRPAHGFYESIIEKTIRGNDVIDETLVYID